jgi:phage FluMu protein Com
MPVRFRCRHCNQLLGIARRKIGTEVSCPTCRNKVLVPAEDSPDVDQPARRNNPLFEGSDLDALLQPGAVPELAAEPAKPAPSPAAAAPAWAPAPPAPAAAPFDAEPYSPPGPFPPAGPPSGVVLSPFQATLLTVGIVVLLFLFFAVGLLIGRFL